VTRERRSLSAHGGAIRTGGDSGAASALAAAFERAAHESPDRYTHAFHSYPARMHPSLAAEILARFADPGELVVDPFAGSGTVPIEAMLAGLSAVGVDRNPLAVRLARVKARVRADVERELIVTMTREIARRSEERVRARVPVNAPLSREEARFYEGHVLKELAGLREEIFAVTEEGPVRELMLMVFSAIVVKFSRQSSETSDEVAPRRIRKGLVTEFFERKSLETVERAEALTAAVPRGAPEPKFHEGNALMLERILRGKRAGLIFTSPPYGGVYDYREHHARRYAWLGIDAAPISREELGARRRLRGASDLERWDDEVRAMLDAFARVLTGDGRVVLMMGDALIGDELVPAERQVAELARDVGLVPVAHASESRPPFRGMRREEHLIYLETR
jgi:DNA modification methylase